MKKFNYFLIGTALLLSVTTRAQDYTLQQAQQAALENNAAIKNADLDIEIARKKVWETTAIGLPHISGTGSFNHYIDIPTQLAPADAFSFPSYLTNFFGGVSQQTGVPLNAPPPSNEVKYNEFKFGLKNNISGGIQVSQLLFDGSYIVGLQTSKIYKELSTKSKVKSEQEIKSLVAQSYYSVLIADESLTIINESVATFKDLVNEMSAMQEQGLISSTEVDQLRITLNDLTNKSKMLDRQKELALLMLKFQMGVALEQEITLTDDIETLVKADEIKTLATAEFDPKSHIDYQLLSTQGRLLEKALQRDRYVQLPTLGAFFNHSQNGYSNDINFKKFYPTTILGVNLNIPIFNSFGQTARIKQSQLEVQKNMNDKQQLETSLKLQATRNKMQLLNNLEQVELEKANMELAERIMNQTIIKKKVGTASSMDVSQATAQYFTAQGNYYNKLLQLLNTQIELKKAINKL